MTRLQRVRLAIVNFVANVLRVPIRAREHYLMGYGYAGTMPRTSTEGQKAA